MDPNILARYLEAIADDMEDTPLDYKLAQVPMSLYSMDTVPVPLDAETYTGDK